MKEAKFVPSNSFGGYHVEIEVCKYRNKNLIRLIPHNGYLDMDDFFLLLDTSPDRYDLPIVDGKLRIVLAEVKRERSYWLLDSLGRVVKYEEEVSFFDKKKGFKRKE